MLSVALKQRQLISGHLGGVEQAGNNVWHYIPF